MYILDSLSFTRTAAATTTPTLNPTTSSLSSVFKQQENNNIVNNLKVTPATIKNDLCEMTTNKYKQLQPPQQTTDPQQQQLQQNRVDEKFMLQKKSSSSPHKIKEMIKNNNNNENLNDELAMTAIENNTTIADNTMPQVQQQQNNDNNYNYKRNDNSRANEWGKVPATYNCKCHHNCYNNCSETNTNTTIDIDATKTNASNTTDATTTSAATSKALDFDKNNIERVEEIMLANIQNNVNLNTFVLPPATATTTLQNVNSSGNSCSSQLGIGMMRDVASEGMFPPLKTSKHSCSPNNYSDCISVTYHGNDDDNGGGGGSSCHNSNNKHKINNNNMSSNNNNNNNVILNTNSFVTVECSRLTCENEREQEESRKQLQNGYENSGNNNFTIAELTNLLGEQERFSPCCDSERFEAPLGNLIENAALPFYDSPIDSVLENFEKFLNAVKLENQNLNQSVPECNDLIDLSDDTKSVCDRPENMMLHDDKCNKLEHNETSLNALLNDKSLNINSIQNHQHQQQKQTCSDTKIHVNNIEKQCNFENLIYCDLNETLEEQNLLESKEILPKTTTAELTQTEAKVVETSKVIKTFEKVNEIQSVDDGNGNVVDNDNDDDKPIPIHDNNNDNTNILMVDEVNETTTKTPVTCINVYSNYNENSKNNSKEQHETCAVLQPKETCQIPNSCIVRTLTAAATTTKTTTATTRVPLENIKRNKICSSSSIENISPQTQNKIQKSHNPNQSANTNNTSTADTATASISSCSTINTQQKHTLRQVEKGAEHKNNCHHSQRQQQQEQEERTQDQFTSAYTLRDFAKCLKPSADEDIIYTLNSTQNQNEKEKLQKFHFNSNSNLNSNKQQLNSIESVSSAIKSIENCDFSEKQLNFNENSIKINENNLYNKNLKADNGINDSHAGQTTFPIKVEPQSALKHPKFLENQEIVKLKDTQFLEIENLSTPKFSNSTNQQGTDAQKSQLKKHDEEGVEFQTQYPSENSCETFKNIENFDNELKFDCNEKIYTGEKYSQPLLYLTFVWPTKNEGQVVTTRRQGNDDQGENEIQKIQDEEKEEQGEETKKEYNSRSNKNKYVDDECECNCKFARRVLEKTYGTCNEKHVGGSHKGRQLKTVERESQEKHEEENFNDNNNCCCVCDCDGDLFEQRILIDKQKREYKNQCLQHNTIQETKNSENFQNKNFIQEKNKKENFNKVFKSENHYHEIKNNEENIENIAKSAKEINVLNEESDKDLCKESCKKFILTSEKCVLQSENSKNITNTTADQVVVENNFHIKSLAIDINRNNPNLNKTESVYNQDNIQNILNLNKGLKRLNETNQNINNNQLLHATPTPNTTTNNNHHHQQQQQQLLLEKEKQVEEDQLNLEEFEASQRLKRLLQQHQQFRTRYDTTTTSTTTQFDNYKQTNAITTATTTTIESESLKTEIARHSKEIPKDNLFIPNNNSNQEGVLNTNTNTNSKSETNTSTSTITTLTKANKLQADYETTLERSSLLHTNEHKQKGIIEINTNPKEQKPILSLKEEQVEKVNEVENEAKDTEKQKEIGKRATENVSNNKETDENVEENKRNSPRAYVSKKIVRLSQQPPQQLRQNHQHSQYSTNPLAKLDLTHKQEGQQHQQGIVIENSFNLRFPTENIDKTEILQKPSPSKRCNLNLQHIVKTKQLLQQQQEEKEFILKPTQTKSCSPPPPLPKATQTTSDSDSQLNEYKSAFVPTKPEIYKSIKPLTGTSGNLTTTTATIPLIPLTATLSEFDTQRFSDFLYLNNLSTSLNNNNYNDNYNNSPNRQITHVLPTQQQQQYLLYATNLVDPQEIPPYCYDELLYLNQTQTELQQPEPFQAINSSTVTTETNRTAVETDVANEIDDDLVSISSTNSSPCDCINCQQQSEQEIDRDRERLFSIDTNIVIPAVSLTETEAVELLKQHQQTTQFKMREVNGQLRGLLKKPNRPPPTRKNRVVFDETRNEFFEADYIILIREDCAYDEEDEEPCTCGEHELVRLCCEEGCQCNYSTAPATTDDNRTPQSPKYAPPIEFVDEAALSPPDGYKDNGLKNTLGGALSGHIFGAQHLQQLQVIQRLQQQRAAMLAARNNSQIPPPPPPATATPASAASVNQQSSSTASSTSSPLTSSSSSTPSATAAGAASVVATTVASNNSMNQSAATQQHSPDDDTQGVCTECAECAECAAKQLQQDTECNSPQCQEDLQAPLGVPAVALLPIHTSSPERRMTQKEIIAGEERPRYVLQAQYKSSPVKNRRDSSKNRNKFITVQKTNNQRYVVETITMTTTTVSERRIVREATEDLAANATASPAATATANALSAGGDSDLLPPALPAKPGAASINNDSSDSEKPPPIPPKESSPTTQISGILKGGKLWKQDSISQSDDQNNTTSEDEAGSTSNGTIKRSVRFVTEEISNDEVDGQSSNADEDNQINELIPIKKHSTLFKNALRPNSAVQQLFPSTVSHQTLTSEALRAFDESKRAGCLVSTLPGSAGDSDTLRRSMERNILRRSLIKKKAVKSDISLEERIKQLTCGIDEDNDESAFENGDDDNSKIEDNADLSHRDSPAGEENPQKFTANGNNSDKSFSPNSSVSSSSSGSSAYKKITEIFNREKKNQEKIMEMEENPIVIIPQECRCPAAPDLGMGVQVPVVHTQIHRTPPRQTEPKRQFLSTLAPLTACVAGNKDDLSSYYTLAAAHHNQAAQNAHAAEYNLAAMMAGEQNSTGISQSTGDEVRKVAPDVIAGTPGQEQQDELAAFAQQEANRTEKIKKRYGNEPANTKEINKEANSDDDEGNDYGFNKRPSVRGIKPKFSSTNEILQQMQDQLSQQMPGVTQTLPQAMKSYTLPKQSSASAMTKQLSQQQPSPQNVPHPIAATSQQQLGQQQLGQQQLGQQQLGQQQLGQQQLGQQQQQMCNAVAPPTQTMQMPSNAAISQQQTEQRTWSFYSETGGAGEQQRLPVESAAAAMQQTYYQTLPAGAMFRHTMIHQQHGPEEAMLYAQNCQAMATTIEPQPHYGHYARSPTRRPESPPPLRNYHQTMVLIPYNAETYSQFAATNMDPKVAHIQRQNILEYQQVGEMTQVTQQTIRVPIGYALPGMQLHVVAGRGQAAQYATAAAAQTHQHQHQRIMTQRYQFAQEASMAGFSERGVPEGAAAVSHSDCTSSGMVSPTTGQQIAMQQQQQQLQQNAQMVQQQQQQQQQINCQQQQQQQPQPQTQNNMQSAAQGSVYYAMNV
ncbi:uncharacterized protein LOC119616463 isoform X2 [Lucilia sericata]|uniref:uncharacterized protein LOC119616463 isoform X2 n=1 Tax=Lucilia sericata TaxID=13632 RepID=UPI0018A87E35|nr:uncharacterized protein LOC119616463 isoform X2 [Lucilia sericata]